MYSCNDDTLKVGTISFFGKRLLLQVVSFARMHLPSTVIFILCFQKQYYTVSNIYIIVKAKFVKKYASVTNLFILYTCYLLSKLYLVNELLGNTNKGIYV